MITADTITNEQIRELAMSVAADERRAANRALHGRATRTRNAARARCAEILNARQVKP